MGEVLRQTSASELPPFPLLIRISRKGGAYRAVNNALIKAHEKGVSPISANHTLGACATGRGTFPQTSAPPRIEQCFASLENLCPWPRDERGAWLGPPSPFLLQPLLLAFAAFPNQFLCCTQARVPSQSCYGLTRVEKAPLHLQARGNERGGRVLAHGL